MHKNSLAIFEPNNLKTLEHIAKICSESPLIPNNLRNRPGDILIILLQGAELGIEPMTSLNNISVINGKPVMNSSLLMAQVLKHPDCIYFAHVHDECSNEQAVYETHRRGNKLPVRITFTWEDAVRAGLAGKENWKRYPAAMLRARCAAALARAVYPDALAGVYDEYEGEEIRGGGGPRLVEVVTPSPAPAPVPAPAPRSLGGGRTSVAAEELLARLNPAPGIEEVEIIEPGKQEPGAPEEDIQIPPGEAFGTFGGTLVSSMTAAEAKACLKELRQIPKKYKLDAEETSDLNELLAAIERQSQKNEAAPKAKLSGLKRK